MVRIAYLRSCQSTAIQFKSGLLLGQDLFIFLDSQRWTSWCGSDHCLVTSSWNFMYCSCWGLVLYNSFTHTYIKLYYFVLAVFILDICIYKKSQNPQTRWIRQRKGKAEVCHSDLLFLETEFRTFQCSTNSHNSTKYTNTQTYSNTTKAVGNV